jgi:lipoic acid synthetase
MQHKRRPEWLKIKISNPKEMLQMRSILKRAKLNTVCQEANCPNCYECFTKKKTATFMILGKYCTRNCRFCNVLKNIPEIVDLDEPIRVAETVKLLNLDHTVITSVTRDDLDDGGAFQFAKVIREIKRLNPTTTIEVLIPDFQGNINALKTVVNEKPDIINHNIETVKRLYSDVRPEANYIQSLELLKNVKKLNSSIYAKSGIMVGLGENKNEVIDTMKDLRRYECDFLTVGQYLQPSSEHYELKEYIHPDIFKYYESVANELGFIQAACSPFVRSSYNAKEFFNNKGKCN